MKLLIRFTNGTMGITRLSAAATFSLCSPRIYWRIVITTPTDRTAHRRSRHPQLPPSTELPAWDLAHLRIAQRAELPESAIGPPTKEAGTPAATRIRAATAKGNCTFTRPPSPLT